MVISTLSIRAEIPASYYAPLEGKSSDDLITALESLSANHTGITYGNKTWDAFKTTDVRMLGNREIWWDMYSNEIVYTDAHESMNIEHAVANSWWGGKTGGPLAYCDLFHLNPSDMGANNKKNDNPPGNVDNASILDNGVLRIGPARQGEGGGAKNVFEPADEYKGDFARAYFYVLTAYNNLGWETGSNSQYICTFTDGKMSLSPWLAEILLKWNNQDPVDSKELSRQEAIYALQQNRNPFIDYPELAEYIWGERKGEAFASENVTASGAIDRPEAPEFTGSRIVGVNTYTRRWWEPVTIPVTNPGEELMISLDGGEFYQYGEGIDIAQASRNLTHKLKAYTVSYVGNREMKSPTAYLTMNAADPEQTDYSIAVWSQVTNISEFSEKDEFVILSDNTLNAMSCSGGTSSNGFMENAGFADFYGDKITELPRDAAVVKFGSIGDGKYNMGIYDVFGTFKGFWKVGSGTKMTLNLTTATPATISFSEEGKPVVTFDGGATLQYNKQQPRFSNYTSKQGMVRLYKFDQLGTTDIPEIILETPEAVSVSGNTILPPAGYLIYDMNGRVVKGDSLAAGIYVVAGAGKAVKVAIR